MGLITIISSSAKVMRGRITRGMPCGMRKVPERRSDDVARGREDKRCYTQRKVFSDLF